MTAPYRLDATARQVGECFGVAAGGDAWAGGGVSPGGFAPVITAGREFVAGPRPPAAPLRMIPRLWGVPPPPAAGNGARGVTVVRNPDSPFWIGNLRHSEFRCLVPATAFMAWGRADPASGRRRRHWLTCGDQPLFAFAGVWKDSEVPSFALLTCQANALLRETGADRMPVILPADPAAWRTWLRADWPRAAPLLAPYGSALMREASPPGG